MREEAGEGGACSFIVSDAFDDCLLCGSLKIFGHALFQINSPSSQRFPSDRTSILYWLSAFCALLFPFSLLLFPGV